MANRLRWRDEPGYGVLRNTAHPWPGYDTCGSYCDEAYRLPDGARETVHAEAIVYRYAGDRFIESRLGDEWFPTVAEAKAWIEQTVTAFLREVQGK